MLNSETFEIERGRNAWPLSQRSRPHASRDYPDVPVMPETLLLVELKARERSVDLREISQLVLGDLGASLQILRRAAVESMSCLDLPIRIEDCISDLGLQTCLDVLARRILSRGMHQAAMETWRHSRRIAELCALEAMAMSSTVNQEEAYLVGLFHELGSLPRILGWDRLIMTMSDEEALGRRMAEDWRLPEFVTDYFRELSFKRGDSPWAKMVRDAHEHAPATPVSI